MSALLVKEKYTFGDLSSMLILQSKWDVSSVLTRDPYLLRLGMIIVMRFFTDFYYKSHVPLCKE